MNFIVFSKALFLQGGRSVLHNSTTAVYTWVSQDYALLYLVIPKCSMCSVTGRYSNKIKSLIKTIQNNKINPCSKRQHVFHSSIIKDNKNFYALLQIPTQVLLLSKNCLRTWHLKRPMTVIKVNHRQWYFDQCSIITQAFCCVRHLGQLVDLKKSMTYTLWLPW